MNVSQYSPNRVLEHEAIGSIDKLPSVLETLDSMASIPPLGSGRSSSGRPSRNEEPALSAELPGAMIEYRLAEDGTARIERCTSDASALEIPELLDGHPVAAVGSHAFCTCYSLEQISLPDALREIGPHAFMNTALRSFDAPAGLRRLGEKAFYKCTQLVQVTLGEGLLSIGASAFRESALASLAVPASVEHIGLDAFKDTGLRVAGELPTLSIAAGSRHLSLKDGALYAMRDGALVLVQLLDAQAVEFVGVPGLTAIGVRALAGCKLLERAYLPDGLVIVSEAAFKGCSELREVRLPDSLRSIGKQAFWSTSIASVRIPASLEWAGIAAFYTGSTIAHNFRPTIRRVEIAEGNTHFFIENGALCARLPGDEGVALLYFSGDPDVVISPRITKIGPYAYMNSARPRSLTIHDRLTTIDVGGLDFGCVIPTVVYEVSGDPPERYVVRYPPNEAGRQTMRMTFGLGTFDIAVAYAECDSAILGTRDVFTRARMMLDRLAEPIYLSERMQNLFRARLAPIVAPAIVEFGRNGYYQGIDIMLDLGVLNERNIEVAIEAAIEADEVAVVSSLIEIRRTRFDAPVFDFEI